MHSLSSPPPLQSILLIEDDALIAELEARPLVRAGLQVTKVETLEAARRAITAAPPDLIFSDLQLAEGTAEETVAFLAGLARTFPIVICSGHYESTRGQELRASSADAGCMDYVDKYDLGLTGGGLPSRLEEAYRRFHLVRQESPGAMKTA